MKILIINELVNFGGTEIQTKREYDFFSTKGHDVYMLSFDPDVSESLEGHQLNIRCVYNTFEIILHRLFATPATTYKIKSIINGICPDVIHINNVWKNCLDVMEAIEEYPVVQTIRDYSALCPKQTAIFADYSSCEGYMLASCRSCISSPKLLLKYFALLKYNKTRIKSVNQFVAPSNLLAERCSANGINTVCVNNPFDFSKIKSSRKNYCEKKVFLYYGLIAEHKGINQLFDALDEIDDEFELWLVGDIEKSYNHTFNCKIKERSYAKHLGKKKYEDIMALYNDVFCVIVPSLWIENYPNTVLEAIANKTLVIGSNRGGIPELIGDKRFLFDIRDKESFVDCIKNVIGIDTEEYASVTNNRYNYIRQNNSQETYYERMMKIYKDIISNS